MMGRVAQMWRFARSVGAGRLWWLGFSLAMLALSTHSLRQAKAALREHETMRPRDAADAEGIARRIATYRETAPTFAAASVFWSCAVAILVASTYRKWQAYCRDERRHRGLCPACGYDLTGNESGVCPECGTRVTWRPKVH